MSEEARSGDRLQASGPGRVAEASVDVPGAHRRLFTQARILQQRGQAGEADRCDRAVRVASPDHFRSLCGLAVSCAQRGERDKHGADLRLGIGGVCSLVRSLTQEQDGLLALATLGVAYRQTAQ